MIRHFFFRKKRAYLDWASAAPVAESAQKAFLNALKAFGNPSSPHEEGRKAKHLLEAARTQIARLAEVKSRAVIFTSGATEANALAIQGRIERLHAEGTDYVQMHILYLPTMHSSVVATLAAMSKRGVVIEEIPLKDTAINLESLRKLIRPETVLVCVDAVCGETGIRFDTLRVKRLLTELSKEAPHVILHVDASQLPLVEPIDYTRLGADLLTLDSQKVGGVRGCGALIISNHRHIAPITYGGGQEQGLRPGTEPVALIASFASALSKRAKNNAGFKKRATAQRALLRAELTKRIPAVMVNEGREQAPHILNISLPKLDTDYIVTLLDTRGISIATKSACESDAEDGSRAVFAHTHDLERAKSTLRISWGPDTPDHALKTFPIELERAVHFLAQH